jgi:ElaA protein
MIQIEWETKPFSRLSTDELYEILKLRVNVFVVEQTCPYHELDGKDRHPETLHLFGRSKDLTLVAYLRILPPGLSFEEAAIGRVVVAKKSRGQGISGWMLKNAMDRIKRTWPGVDIKIGAQVYLTKFYESLGFQSVSEAFLEDGIPHIDMLKKMNA